MAKNSTELLDIETVAALRRQSLDAVAKGIREAKPHYQISAHEANFSLSIPPCNNRLIACQPKSASTFLANILSNILQIPVDEYSGYGTDPRTVSVDKVLEIAERPAVIHQHCQATRPTLGLFRAAKLRPVALIRDVEDALMSQLRHRLRNSDHNKRDRGLEQMALEDQIGVNALESASWFVRFQVGWYAAMVNDFIPTLLIDYDDLTAHPNATVVRVLEHWGEPVDMGRIASAVETVTADPVKANYGTRKLPSEAEFPENIRRSIRGLFIQEGIRPEEIKAACAGSGIRTAGS